MARARPAVFPIPGVPQYAAELADWILVELARPAAKARRRVVLMDILRHYGEVSIRRHRAEEAAAEQPLLVGRLSLPLLIQCDACESWFAIDELVSLLGPGWRCCPSCIARAGGGRQCAGKVLFPDGEHRCDLRSRHSGRHQHARRSSDVARPYVAGHAVADCREGSACPVHGPIFQTGRKRG